MIYVDRIYGKTEIDNPVILELIHSSSFQRLKGVDQAGYFEPYFPGTKHSRFEHSIGVYLLLKKFGAAFNEQLAGLIHDVSHATFSHCIDYVLALGSQKEHDHQDKIFKNFVKRSTIASIIEKHNINLDYILNENNFPLKERKLPDLCADRIDYSLRTAIIFKEINLKEAYYFLDNLMIKSKLWVFKNVDRAQKYARLFLKLNQKYYAGIESAAMFATVGDYLKYALQRNYITADDLYTTDKQVLIKIKRHFKKDQHLNLLYDRMNNKVTYIHNHKDYNIKVFCKSRIVDPFCQYQGKILRVSEIDKNWSTIVEKESKPKKYFLKFIDPE